MFEFLRIISEGLHIRVYFCEQFRSLSLFDERRSKTLNEQWIIQGKKSTKTY